MLDQPAPVGVGGVGTESESGTHAKTKIVRPPGWAHRCLRDWLRETRNGSCDAIREAAIEGDRGLISNPM